MKFFVLVVMLLLCFGCENEPVCHCAEVVDIKQQHATRAYVGMKCSDGRVITNSYHWSNNIECNGKKYFVVDYIPGYGNKKFEHTN